MHLGEWACVGLSAVVVAPIVLVSIPIALPAAIMSVIIFNRRFWRLQTGDVLGTSYVVLHPPKRGSKFRILKLDNPNTLHVWNNVDTAESDLCRILPESFMETMYPIRCTKRLPLHEVVELLMAGDAGGYRSIKHDAPAKRYFCEYADEQDLLWMRCRSFEQAEPGDLKN